MTSLCRITFSIVSINKLSIERTWHSAIAVRSLAFLSRMRNTSSDLSYKPLMLNQSGCSITVGSGLGSTRAYRRSGTLHTTADNQNASHAHMCVECGATFDSYKDLKIHREQHAEERPYETEVLPVREPRIEPTGPAPRNLIDLYRKNPSWIGRLHRLPEPPPVLCPTSMSKQLAEENQKLRVVEFDDISGVKWTPRSKRIGALGIKLGTTIMWMKDGTHSRVTLIQIKDCHVVQSYLSERDGGTDQFTKVLLGAVDEDLDQLSKIDQDAFEWFERRGIMPKKKCSSFFVTKDALLPSGTEITARHFQAGQTVRCKAVSIDQGFQGVMKRWGMKGQPASHGQTKTHRKMGATGGGTDPGLIRPGKRMPGQMGGNYHTTCPLKVMRIDEEYSVLYVRGPVPGLIGGFVKIVDFLGGTGKKSVKYKFDEARPPPFPTHFVGDDTPPPSDYYADYAHDFSHPSIEFAES